MTFMLTATAVPFALGRPRAADVRLDDVSHHLALINRFCGATVRPYSVAEHSLLVVEICERTLGLRDPSGLLAALMHDAHEAWKGDIISPVKQLLGAPMQVLEHSLESAVRDRYGLHTAAAAYRQTIRQADLIALATERRDLLPPHDTPWPILHGIEPAEWIDLRTRDGMDWRDWRQAFADKWHELNTARVALMGAMGKVDG